MTVKSLLLGAAAGMVAVGAAQAADLPMTKGEAVEYVKVCSAFGPGFFYIPGSDTCLKIFGEVRAEYRVFGGSGDAKLGRNDDRSAFNAQARLKFDARTETEWGLLRSFIQINADSHPISDQGRGGVYNGGSFTLDKAFIQFGGLTAGYAHSFFGFYDNDYGSTLWAPYYASANTVNLLAYTAQFGGGFSATVALEDGRDHRYSNLGLNYITGLPAGLALASSGLVGGQQMPDVVAQLRLDQSWGSVAVSGAVHQSRTADALNIAAANNGVPLGLISIPVNHSQKWGYAVGGTVLFKIPAIDNGHFVVEAQYADGALNYLGAGNGNGFGGAGAPGDLYISRVAGGRITGVNAAKGWSIVAELGGNITPALAANLVGSYISTKADNAYRFAGLAGSPSFKAYTIAGNMTYTIVKDLTIGAEVSYTHNKYDDVLDVTGPTLTSAKSNVWQGGIRLTRTF